MQIRISNQQIKPLYTQDSKMKELNKSTFYYQWNKLDQSRKMCSKAKCTSGKGIQERKIKMCTKHILHYNKHRFSFAIYF